MGYEVLYMCVTPSKKDITIYEMLPADVPREALDEFKRLQATYESPHHSHLMSRDGVKETFYKNLKNGVLDIDKFVASLPGSCGV